ncbi:40S ribosomal protein S27-2-like protein [Tanacetum coccineum]
MPPAQVEKRKYKLKRLVQSPNYFFFFMDVKCQGCILKQEMHSEEEDGTPYLHVSQHQHAMRRMSNSGGHFAKKTKAEKKSASSCSSNDVIFMVTSGQSLLAEEGWEGTKVVNGQRQEIISSSDAACKLCLE